MIKVSAASPVFVFFLLEFQNSGPQLSEESAKSEHAAKCLKLVEVTGYSCVLMVKDLENSLITDVFQKKSHGKLLNCIAVKEIEVQFLG